MEINKRLSDRSAERRFSLTLNGVNVCDLSFDEFGKYTIGLTKIDDVHKFCRLTLAVILTFPPAKA